jgi:hypothetical protein
MLYVAPVGGCFLTTRSLAEEYAACWIAKGVYHSLRIARMLEVSTTLARVLAEDGYSNDLAAQFG